jgi:hypothetical protein
MKHTDGQTDLTVHVNLPLRRLHIIMLGHRGNLPHPFIFMKPAINHSWMNKDVVIMTWPRVEPGNEN